MREATRDAHGKQGEDLVRRSDSSGGERARMRWPAERAGWTPSRTAEDAARAERSARVCVFAQLSQLVRALRADARMVARVGGSVRFGSPFGRVNFFRSVCGVRSVWTVVR